MPKTYVTLMSHCGGKACWTEVFKVWKAERKFWNVKGTEVTGDRTNEKLHVGQPTECFPGAGFGGKVGTSTAQWETQKTTRKNTKCVIGNVFVCRLFKSSCTLTSWTSIQLPQKYVRLPVISYYKLLPSVNLSALPVGFSPVL